MMLVFIILSVLRLSLTFACGNGDSEAAPINYRLPRNIVPRHYNIKLRTEAHTGNRSFDGSVNIWMNVVGPTDQIILNSVNLTIQHYRMHYLMHGVSPVELEDLQLRSDSLNKQIIMNTANLLMFGEYLLSIDFNGTAGENTSYGLLVRSYFDEDGVEHPFLVSHFAPANMRRVIPSFDDPALKATFNLTIVHHRSYTAYSNMPLDKPPELYPFDHNYLISSFQQTPRMSTFLIALAVVDFTTQSLGNHTAVVRPSESYGVKFPLELAQNFTDILGEHTGLKYADFMPKQTHLVIPPKSNQTWSAMENWGLVIYREQSFLYAPSRNTTEELLNAMRIITHELAHQWFGNLVTPEWWSHLWLKEGFATLYSYYALHLMRPAERWMDYFKVLIKADGLVEDKSNKTITCSVDELVPECYSPVVYTRAAGIIDMFRQLVGDASWIRIVQRLLRDHQLGNVVPKDLYALITEETSTRKQLFPGDLSVGTIFDTWLSKPGSPVLRVRRLGTTGKFIISQQRSVPCTNETDLHWIIPYSYTYESEANFEGIGPVHWLTTPATLITTNATYDEWIVFNKMGFGAYRVNYDDHDWRLIIRALRANVSCIHMQNKAQLLDDAHALVLGDMMPLDLLLELLTYLRNETDLLLWASGDDILKTLYDYFIHPTDYYDQFRVVHLHLMERVYESLPSSPEALSPAERKAFYQITHKACFLGSKKCLREATLAFVKSADTNTAVLPDEQYVYCYGHRNTRKSQFAWLMKQFRTERHYIAKLKLMEQLLCATQVDRLRRVIIAIDRWYKRTSSESDKNEILKKLEETLIKMPVLKQLDPLIQIMSMDALIDELSMVVLKKVMYAMWNLVISKHDFEIWEKFGVKVNRKFFMKRVDYLLRLDDEAKVLTHSQVTIVSFLDQYCEQWKLTCKSTG